MISAFLSAQLASFVSLSKQKSIDFVINSGSFCCKILKLICSKFFMTTIFAGIFFVFDLIGFYPFFVDIVAAL